MKPLNLLFMNLIEDWKRRKKTTKKHHQKLINRLKRETPKKLNALADTVHEEVFNELDCLDCANCCTSIPPIVNRTDASRIAKHLGMKSAQFQAQYLRQDEDGDMVMNTSPCPFLQTDHTCLIYEYRPKACRKYPHTDNFEFANHFKLHQQNTMYCPAVFHILERIGERLLF